MRACVYTAIYGGYDSLLQPVPQSVPCDFFCFTDAEWPARVGAWQVIRSGLNAGLHPRLRAKYFKCMSHAVFPGGRLAWRFAPFAFRKRYDAIIWIDGCIRVTSADFAREFTAHLGEHGMALFVHPDRSCIYDEFEVSAGMAKYAGQGLAEQVAAYRSEGFPERAGLAAGGLIARRVGHRDQPAVNAAWWAENLRWSYQDQLSLPVVLWRLGLGYDPVRLDLWDNSWFDRLQHHADT